MIFTYWDGSEIPGDLPSVPEWKQRFPDFRVYLESDVLPLLERRFPHYRDLYRRIQIPACKSDIARLLLLYEYGGLYVDAHVGPASGDRIAELFATLATYDIVLFDLQSRHKDETDLHIINSVLCARKNADILLYLLQRAFANLVEHWRREQESGGFVPYNIFVLTGGWSISIYLFDHSLKPIRLRKEYERRVHVHLLRENMEPGCVEIHKYLQYHKPGEHWSERQNTEPLFENCPASPLSGVSGR